MPVRLQRRRTKGYRLPPDAVYVGRPSLWGNPYRRADYIEWYDADDIPRLMVSDFRNGCIERTFIMDLPDYPDRGVIRRDLAGRDLVCWCALDQPCHADVLLELANR